jgi:hypothetical protein
MAGRFFWVGVACIASSLSGAQSAHGREVFFDSIVTIDDSDSISDYRLLSEPASGGSAPKLVYQGVATVGTGKINLRNGTSTTGTPSNELFFDIVNGSDDIDTSITFRTPNNSATNLSLAGPLLQTPTSFSTSLLVTDPAGASPPVTFSFVGQLNPGLGMDPSSGAPVVLEILQGSAAFSINLLISDPQTYNPLAPIFSTFLMTAVAVPEVSGAMCGVVALVACAIIWRRRLRRHPAESQLRPVTVRV